MTIFEYLGDLLKTGDIKFPNIRNHEEASLIVNLLTRILQVDQRLRPSATDLLLDPFFLADERKRLKKDKLVMEKDEKIKLFMDSLPSLSGEFFICVARENVMGKLVDLVFRMNESDLLKSLMVEFEDETGYGQGLTRELFTLFFLSILQENQSLEAI